MPKTSKIILSRYCSKNSRHRLFERWFCDEAGHIALIQLPNPPLIIWLFTAALQHILKTGPAHSVLVVIATASLAWWSYLEIISGVNYFRRALGIIVMALLIIGVFNKLF